jgi:glycosyltransferase involved in cell wall biosynthesis
MNSKHQNDSQDEVAAIITAMTDAEQPFLRDAVASVLSDPGIGQVVLCIEQQNSWLHSVLGSLISDPRLEVVQIPLASSGAVRNQALKQVRLPWVAYCDGDDVWCPGKTITQLADAKTTGCDFVGADNYLTNDKGQIRACALSIYLPMPSAWMVKTAVMRKHPFNEVPFSVRDEVGEWWIRTTGLVSRARCPKILLRYRVRENSLSTTTPSMQRKRRVVDLANKPGLGGIILFVTWCIWRFTQKNTFTWNENWGEQPGYKMDQEMESIN